MTRHPDRDRRLAGRARAALDSMFAYHAKPASGRWWITPATARPAPRQRRAPCSRIRCCRALVLNRSPVGCTRSVNTPFGSEPSVDVRQRLERPHHQPGADHQHERQRDLGHHERAARSLATRAAGDAARAAQRVLHVASARRKRRREAEHDAHEDRERRAHREHRRVERDRARAAACPAGARRRSTLTPTAPSATPAAAPPNARTTLSTSICAITRARVAPSVVRTAISRRRPAARMSSRLPTFAPAISTMNPTAASRTSSARAHAADRALLKRQERHVSIVVGRVLERLAHRAGRASRARRAPARCRALPKPRDEPRHRAAMEPGGRVDDERRPEIARGGRAPRSPAGSTPMTVYGVPSSVMVRPMIGAVTAEALGPERVTEDRDGSRPGIDSSSSNERPIIGRDAEHVEEVGGNARGVSCVGLAGAGERHSPAGADGRDTVERRAMLAQIQQFGVRDELVGVEGRRAARVRGTAAAAAGCRGRR